MATTRKLTEAMAKAIASATVTGTVTPSVVVTAATTGRLITEPGATLAITAILATAAEMLTTANGTSGAHTVKRRKGFIISTRPPSISRPWVTVSWPRN